MPRDLRARPTVIWFGMSLLLGFAASASPSSTEKSTPSALERDPTGWIDLLQGVGAGAELKGWTRAPIPPGGKLDAESQWSYNPATGILTCEGTGGHDWVRWDRELGDFIYHVEWRFTPVPGKKGYNSGIYVRNSADAKIWHQAQTGDAKGGYLFGDTRVGDKIERVNLSKQARADLVKPAGAWNTFEIRCQGNTMSLWVNRAVALDWQECQVPRGYVGLEAERFRIEFRRVMVKPLAP